MFFFNIYIVTHCLEIPDPSGTNPKLIAKGYETGDYDPIPFGQNVSYTCEKGQKFESSIEIESVDAQCLDGNIWVDPNWDQCVTSTR